MPFGMLSLNLPESGSLLEIGCGEGLVLEMLGPGVAPVVGVDFDSRKLQLAQSRLSARSNTALIESDAFEYLKKQSDCIWDCVMLVDTLSSFPETEQPRLLTESLRVLAPNGLLILKTIDGAAGLKTTFSRALSFLIYRVFRLSRSSDQQFHYASEDDLKMFFGQYRVSMTVLRLHEIVFHVVPHLLFLIKKEGGAGT